MVGYQFVAVTFYVLLRISESVRCVSSQQRVWLKTECTSTTEFLGQKVNS